MFNQRASLSLSSPPRLTASGGLDIAFNNAGIMGEAGPTTGRLSITRT
jgi:hypothetical protein